MDSAFNHVEVDKYETKLMHVKGKRVCRVQEVKLDKESMNEGDAFVLDAGLTLYVWCGKECNKYESAKASEVIMTISHRKPNTS